MDVSRLGHATVLLQTSRVRVLVDPGVFSDAWHGLTGVDLVLVTHQHADHVDVPNLAGLITANPAARVLAEPAVVGLVGEHDVEAGSAHPGQTISIGDLEVAMVGGVHAEIHHRIPRIGNVGFVFSEGDGPRLFHPGDAYDTTPPAVDVLALPLAAPWARAAHTIDFLDAVAPGRAFPIHDAMLGDDGRATFLRVVGTGAEHGSVLEPVAGDATLSI